jgi:hypothetical protein
LKRTDCCHIVELVNMTRCIISESNAKWKCGIVWLKLREKQTTNKQNPFSFLHGVSLNL